MEPNPQRRLLGQHRRDGHAAGPRGTALLATLLGGGQRNLVPERARFALPHEAGSSLGGPPALAGTLRMAKPALKEAVQGTSTVNNGSNVYAGYRFLPVLQIFVHCKA